MRRRALLTAPIALGALIAGYLWGFGVGEREGHDSDPVWEEGESEANYADGTPKPGWRRGQGYAGGSTYYEKLSTLANAEGVGATPFTHVRLADGRLVPVDINGA